MRRIRLRHLPSKPLILLSNLLGTCLQNLWFCSPIFLAPVLRTSDSALQSSGTLAIDYLNTEATCLLRNPRPCLPDKHRFYNQSDWAFFWENRLIFQKMDIFCFATEKKESQNKSNRRLKEKSSLPSFMLETHQESRKRKQYTRLLLFFKSCRLYLFCFFLSTFVMRLF